MKKKWIAVLALTTLLVGTSTVAVSWHPGKMSLDLSLGLGRVATALAVAWGEITGTLANQTDLDSALGGKAASTHAHAGTDITSGTIDAARLPTHAHAGTDITSGTINAARLPTAIDAANLADGSISNTEFQYLNGLTGNIQGQFDTKAASTLNKALADLEYDGVTETRPVSGTVVVGDFCAQVDSGGGAEAFAKKTANSATSLAVGVCVASDGSNRTVLISGRYRNDTLFASFATIGAKVISHDSTNGGIQLTDPASTKYWQMLGTIANVTGGKIMYVNPQLLTFQAQ